MCLKWKEQAMVEVTKKNIKLKMIVTSLEISDGLVKSIGIELKSEGIQDIDFKEAELALAKLLYSKIPAEITISNVP